MRSLSLLLIAGLSLPAQATTLKELLAGADAANIERRISVEQRKKAAAEFKAAWTTILPSLSIQGGWTHNQYPVSFELAPGAPPLVITPAEQFDLSARLELPLIDTTRWFRASAAGAAEDASIYRESLTLDMVHRQVATTWYSYAAALALRESSKRSLGVADAQLNLQDIRSRAGAATELEVLRAKAEQMRNRQTLADTETLVANLRRALLTLTAIDVGDTASLPADDLNPEGTLAAMEAKSEDLPAVKAADKDSLAAERIATAGRLALVPIITASANQRLTNAPGFIARAGAYTAGIGFFWRFDGNLFNMASLSAQARMAELAAERQRLAVRDQIHADWQRLRAAIEKVTAARAQVEAAQRAAEVARDRYAAGAATQIDVIQSERDLFSAEVNSIQARTELASSHVGLRISSGLPVVAE